MPTCPAGHQLQFACPGLTVCVECEMAFAFVAGAPSWEPCHWTYAAAREAAALRRQCDAFCGLLAACAAELPPGSRAGDDARAVLAPELSPDLPEAFRDDSAF